MPAVDLSDRDLALCRTYREATLAGGVGKFLEPVLQHGRCPCQNHEIVREGHDDWLVRRNAESVHGLINHRIEKKRGEGIALTHSTGCLGPSITTYFSRGPTVHPADYVHNRWRHANSRRSPADRVMRTLSNALATSIQATARGWRSCSVFRMMASRRNAFSATPSAGMKARCTGFNGHGFDARRAKILENKRTRTEETVMGRNLSGVEASGALGISVVLACFRASGTYDVYSQRLKSRARVDRGQLLSCRTVRRSGPAAESSGIAWRLAATSSVIGFSIPHCGSLMGYTGRVSGGLGLNKFGGRSKPLLALDFWFSETPLLY